MWARTFPIFAFFLLACAANAQDPLLGDARALTLIDASGQPLEGSFSSPQWETRGDGLFFLRENAGTRDIWRAAPAKSSDGARYAPWLAAPLTAFSGSQKVESVVPLAGDDALFAVGTIFPSGENPSHLARFDLKKRVWSKVALEAGQVFEAAPSADGKWLVFSCFNAKARPDWQICALSLQKKAAARATLVVANARRPLWLDDSQLLFQSLAPLNSGLFRATLDGVSLPQLVLNGAGEATPLADGQFLVLAAQAQRESASQLYLMARDGSGLRALNSSMGARHPVAAPDGQWLAFDAPLPGKTTRALWILPTRTVRTRAVEVQRPKPAIFATLGRVQLRGKTGLEIRGSYDSGADSSENSVEIEVGAGETPQMWQKLPLKTRKRARTAPDTSLAFWTAPPGANGPFTARLTVNSPLGSAQSVLPFVWNAPIDARFVLPAVPTLAPGTAPLMFLPPAPPKIQLAQDDSLGGPILPPPAPFPTPIPRPTATPQPASATDPQPTPRPFIEPEPTPARDANPDPTPLAKDGANINVVGTLSDLAAGATMHVAFWGQNKGNRAWTPQDVRLVARWVDFSTGTRRKWQFKWMKSVVAPGNQTRFEFDVSAPTRPGRYKLIYGLVRLKTPSAPFEAPPYSAAQESWPGEFAAIAFAVNVAPANSLAP